MNYLFYFPLIFWFASILKLIVDSLFTKLMYAYMLFILVMVVGTRWFVAADFDGYFGIYNEIPLLVDFNFESTKQIYGEIGYLFIGSIFRSLDAHFTVFVFFTSLVSLIVKYFVISKFPYGFLAFSIYLLIAFISVELIEVRWSVSISFILLAYYFGLLLRQNSLATLFFLCSLAFHYYSILFIILYFVILFVKYTKVYYVLFSFSVVWAVYIYIFGFNFSFNADSELYVMERFFRYINDPDSKVGFFSILKAIYIMIFYHFVRWLSKSKGLHLLEQKLVSIFLLVYSVSLILSFVPVFYFRASIVADVFGLILVFTAVGHVRLYSDRITLLVAFSIPFLLWFLVDISNSFSADRIFSYSSSLELII